MQRSFSAWLCWLTASLACALGGPATTARAEEMDLALERLVTGVAGACELTLQTPPVLTDVTGNTLLSPDDASWAALMAELSAATQPALMQPVTTSGPKGIDAQLIHSTTGIRPEANYWQRGSRGSGAGSQRDCSGENRSVRGTLNRTQLRLLKSLPFGVTIGSTFGRLWKTHLWTFGGEIKVAVVEGYRSLAVPDIALRFAANTVVGDGQYTLTNLAASVLVSKPFVLARLMRLTPYVAYQVGIALARSSLIDLTPHTDAFAVCDAEAPGDAGTLACTPGNSIDLANDQPFDDLVVVRHQLGVGFTLRYRYGTLTAEFLADAVPASKSTPRVPSQVLRQWSLGIAPGVSF